MAGAGGSWSPRIHIGKQRIMCSSENSWILAFHAAQDPWPGDDATHFADGPFQLIESR